MIQKILSKVLEELNSPTPNISYIRGMVEVLIASETPSSTVEQRTYIPPVVGSTPSVSTDPEVAALDSIARANLDKVKNGMTVE